MASVCVESGFILNATLRSVVGTFITDTVTNCTHRERVDPPDNVNVTDDDEPDGEPVSESLDSAERSFLSQRQCRLIYQQLRKSDVCLEESFSALM